MSKIISINNELYEKLKRLKGRESFSMIIKDLLKNKKAAGRPRDLIDVDELKRIKK